MQFALQFPRTNKEIEGYVQKMHDEYKNEYLKLYDPNTEIWEGLNRFEMLKRFIADSGTLYHPYWDEFILYKIEHKAKKDFDFAEIYFTKIEKTTRFDFSIWLIRESGFFSGKILVHENDYGKLKLFYEECDGRVLSIITNKENAIKFIYKDLLIWGWQRPYELFIDNIAYCAIKNKENEYLFGLVNSTGEYIKYPQYTYLSNEMIDNKLIAFSENGLYGFMRISGEIVIPPEYDNVSGILSTDSYDGFGNIMFETNGKKGFMDFSLNELLPCKYKDIFIYDERGYGEKKDFVVEATTFKNSKEYYVFKGKKLIKRKSSPG